jgi:hypothetical protein
MFNPRRLRLSPLSISGQHTVPIPVSTVRGFNSFGIKVHIPGRDAKEPTGAMSRGSSWHIDLGPGRRSRAGRVRKPPLACQMDD